MKIKIRDCPLFFCNGAYHGNIIKAMGGRGIFKMGIRKSTIALYLILLYKDNGFFRYCWC